MAFCPSESVTPWLTPGFTPYVYLISTGPDWMDAPVSIEWLGTTRCAGHRFQRGCRQRAAVRLESWALPHWDANGDLGAFSLGGLAVETATEESGALLHAGETKGGGGLSRSTRKS